MEEFEIQSITNHDDNFWRVDWFGCLSYVDSAQGHRRSQVLVDVYLSKLFKHPKNSNLNYKTSTDHGNPLKVQVPVEYLVIFRIGDIWHKGKYFSTPDYLQLSTGSINVSSQNTDSYFSYHRFTDGSFLIPFKNHPYHQSATRVYCERLILPSGQVIIIPHWVILQAYFARCSYVFSQLFEFGLAFDKLFDPNKSELVDGKGLLQLRKEVDDAAAADVARIAWDSATNKAYRMVSQNLALTHCHSEFHTKLPSGSNIQNSNTGPKTKLPIEGLTNLKFRGKYLTGDQITGPFIVFEILSCSADMPFETLDFYRDNPGDTIGRSERQKALENSKKYPPRINAKHDKDLQLIPAKEPIRKIDKLKLLLKSRAGTEHTGLNNKQIIKKHFNDISLRAKQGAITIDVDCGNAGDGDSNGEGAPVSFAFLEGIESKKKIHLFDYPICRLKIFRFVCRDIARLPEVKNVKFIRVNPQLGGFDDDYSYFPETRTETGRDRKWRYIDYIKGSRSSGKKLRRALVAQVTAFSNVFYIIEVERRTVCVNGQWGELDAPALLIIRSKKHFGVLPENDLQRLFRQCAENSGTWLSKNNKNNYLAFLHHIKPLSHPDNTTLASPEDHRRRIVTNIKAASGMKRVSQPDLEKS
ncbi:hypothetical protein K6Y31_04695 [Motilimonas cestriensis]|uniref:Uncharacterized protein n=1 Tax=Motilimonas cestriensis TaxID=2742685 RepID=A0ABS8W8N0_9GAMM|nr:hypothetical protein [Motilimonas cestriensis]MCE2594108.1 hypothetical protein [Motilimonas cestriensis]